MWLCDQPQALPSRRLAVRNPGRAPPDLDLHQRPRRPSPGCMRGGRSSARTPPRIAAGTQGYQGQPDGSWIALARPVRICFQLKSVRGTLRRMLDLIPLKQPEKSLFWGAAVAEDSELATEDPLALDYVAQQIGMLLLPPFTTRSTRAQGFAMVAYGLHLAERALDAYTLSDTDEVRRELFERWERFWALATLELRGGRLPRGDWDAMRGIRGAQRAWFEGDKPLRLDFQMISRQQELGNLGAYLVPMRRAGLVLEGTVRPGPAALEIIDAFWDERGDGAHISRFENYALTSLEPGRKTLERKHGGLTLATVGERSRLTSLIHRGRHPQQDRLYEALFSNARDNSTLAMAGLIQSAAVEGIDGPRDLLDAAIAGSLGPVAPELRDLLATARAFGDMLTALISTFDRAYMALDHAGWIEKRDAVANKAFAPEDLARLKEAAAALLTSPRVHDIRRLPMHGAALLGLVEDLRAAGPAEALDRLLFYHGAVQRDRRRGESWMRADGDRLILGVTNYSARPESPRYPSFKFDVVRTLLMDTGRLPWSTNTQEVA